MGRHDDATRPIRIRRRRGDGSAVGGASAQVGLLAIVARFWVVFSSLAPGFLSPFNLFTVGRSLAVDIVIGFSQMVVLATGGMNLAVGAIGVCAVMATGYSDAGRSAFRSRSPSPAGWCWARCSAG